MNMSYLILSLIFFTCCHAAPADDPNWGLAHGGDSYNATVDAIRVLCVYQLSGQYCLLNRLLYYALIIFLVVGHSHVWLVAGAMASALTYSSTAAIHAIILAGISKNGLFDIDALGAWAIVSVGCLAVLPIFTISSKIRESKFSPVFGLWGSLVAVGAFCGIVSIYRDYPDEPECRSTTSMDLLTTSAQLLDPNFNCSYSCFSYNQPLRATSELVAIPKSLAFAHFNILQAGVILTGLFGVVSGVFGCCYSADSKRTEAELRTSIKANRRRDGDLPKIRRAKANSRNRAQNELNTGEYAGNSGLGICWSVLGVLALLVVLVLNEVFLLGYDGGFPSNEQPFAVGQWGQWVGIFLALSAAAIVKIREPKWEERQRTLAKEKEEFLRRKTVAQATKQSKQPLKQSDVQDTTNVSQTGSDYSGRQRTDVVVARSQSHSFSCVDLEAGTEMQYFGEMTLVQAAEKGDEEGVRKHLSQRVMNKAKAKDGVEALVRAAGNGRDGVVRLLLDAGTDVNAADSVGLTALMRAAWGGRESVVQLLIERGATVKGHQGKVSLTRALTNHHSKVAELLKASGAEV